jgi:HD-like signal output (HDOD) protein
MVFVSVSLSDGSTEMPQPKLTARRPTRQEIRQPAMLRRLPDASLDELRRHSEVIQLPANSRIVHKDTRRSHLMFVLEGQWTVEDSNGATQHIQGGTTRSHFPLIPLEVAGARCTSGTPSEILRVPLNLLGRLQQSATNPGPQLSEHDEGGLEDRIYKDFHQGLKKGEIKLPAMPDVAVRIARHIDNPESTSDSIARIVQMDPSVTARLIQVANSPAFGGRARIETARDAVTRLGRQTTRNLITSFVLRGVFRSRSPLVKQKMQELWAHSTQVAAICHALAKRSPGFEPSQALLIGLVHDIGVIPILTQAHLYEGLEENPDLLERVIQRLRGDISAVTLRNWGFGADFVNCALEAEDWFRNKQPEVDYGDILIMAQLHAFIGSEKMADKPRIDEVPAFRKLALGDLSPRMSLLVLDEAKREIEGLRVIIAG